SKIYAGEFVARPSPKSAGLPRPVVAEVHITRVVPVEQFVELGRPILIFLIPPTGCAKRWSRDLTPPRPECLPFPARILIRLLFGIVPRRIFIMQIILIDI